jgi:hypothetical protein
MPLITRMPLKAVRAAESSWPVMRLIIRMLLKTGAYSTSSFVSRMAHNPISDRSPEADR